MGGGMETNKNRFIEEWGSVRENLEHNFRWSRRNLALVGIFGLAVPILVYKGIVREFTCISKWVLITYFYLLLELHMQDEDAGRPYRKFL
ncbi:Neuronal acetylcholine receptor subunit alpha [Quillaja saponaria]|uniref:Neuronal acetylcholine receptor subunit alpha n=1 Tax=Quillaja saponaria TaxID=32244 RepID=A0AAD7Q2L7_QUISA|nr:Neuronal acetylcholine receptor subunit alpha [Quillaja saponaria]